ncbi:hypothetical protein FG152_24570 [Ochrobactrum sp. XJ1]|nr:hypothetical protein [Ochrobactrum sp. XJ1]
MSNRSHLRIKVLLASTASLFIGLTASGTDANAAPVVNGRAGCIAGDGQQVTHVVRIPGPGGSEQQVTADVCKPGANGENGNGWVYNSYVSAGEVNSAFQQQENYINNVVNKARTDLTNYIDQRVNNAVPDLSAIHAKNAEQDNRLNANDTKNSQQDTRLGNAESRLGNVETKNTQQDTRLNNVETKNTQQDTRLDGVDKRLGENDQKNAAQDATLADHESRISDGEKKNTEQDAKLSDHENRITAGEQKNAEQDARLDEHDRLLADHEDRITEGEKKNAEQDAKLADHENRITETEKKNAEQDVILADHEGRITDTEKKNAEQDVTLADHEGRITESEKNIKDVSDNAVFYDRDADGNKTGGLTLNDGTGKEVQLGNVAAGKGGTDATNVDQLSGALDGLGGGAKINEDGSVTGPSYNVGGVDYNNVGDALKATNKLGVQYVPDENGNPTNTVVLTGDGTGPVKITNVAAGTADSDAVNYGQVKDNISYDRNSDGSRSNSITLTGGGAGPVSIHNLADGKADSDAATVRQVNKARQDSFDYTDQRISELAHDSSAQFAALSGEISKTRTELRAGVASAMAMASLKFDDRPGKASIAGSIGGFKGSTSIATGFGYTSEDGNWRVNAGIAHSFATNDTSWNAGASFTLN